jgi:hypothetical protein
MTQGDRQDYKWRPNDNSVQTKLRYDLEAEHWTRAFKSAQINSKTSSAGEVFGVVGLCISLVSSLVVLIVLSIIDVIKWLRRTYSKQS